MFSVNSIKDSLRRIFYASTYEHALEGIEVFKKQWDKIYPSALECLFEAKLIIDNIKAEKYGKAA